MNSKTYTDSSVAKKISYDDEKMIMTIEYVTGSTYEYADVPRQVFDMALEASSIGSFIHYYIKNKFKYRTV